MLTDDDLFEIEKNLRASDVCYFVKLVCEMMIAKASLGLSEELPEPENQTLFKEVKKLYKTIFRLKPPAYYDEQINMFVNEGLKMYFGGGNDEN